MDQMGSFSRIRGDTAGYDVFNYTTHLYYADGTFRADYPHSIRVIGNQENIYDTPHRMAHGTFGWKYPPGKVFHQKVRSYPIAKHMVNPILPDGSYATFEPWLPPAGELSAIGTIVPSLSDVDFYSLNREAYNYFSDAFPQVMSFSEFVVGLRELGDLIPRLQESMAKSFSGGYLNKEFGWDNLLSDLNTLGGIVQVARDRLNYLKRTYGIPTRLGFSRPNLSPLTHHIGEEVDYSYEADTTIRYKLTDARLDMRATATIVQTLDFIDGTIGLIRSLAGALGLNNPVKAIWVNLPFSFVIDWFFKISNHLDTLTRANPATGWNVSNVTCSYKLNARFDMTFMLSSPTYSPSSWDAGYIILDEYRRFSNLPLSVQDLMPVSELSPNQLTLLLALLHQQG